MKRFIDKYDLKKGILLSIAFPTIFLALDSNPSNIWSHFIFSFIVTFCFWIVNAVLINFKISKTTATGKRSLYFYTCFAASFIVAIVIYISLGLLLQRSGIVLSPVRGNWGASFSSWFYLCIKIILFNSLIILIKYLF